jgi:hypothetical protein
MKFKISAIELKNIFLESFSKEIDYKYENGNPFLIHYEKKSYHVFLKNISPAYYPQYPDITRIQLPFSIHFKKISKSSFPFIILGYDSEYDTFSAWDPQLIKNRLNAKNNVSLFSRDSFQERLDINIFNEHKISNGDKVIVFSSKSLPFYFRNYESLFGKPEVLIKNINKIEKNKKNTNIEIIQILKNISNLKEMSEFKLDNNLIGAVIFCTENYSIQYPDMTIPKWTTLVNAFFREEILL